jgi:SUMO ligase MMS21 Smc5/6 complex component
MFQFNTLIKIYKKGYKEVKDLTEGDLLEGPDTFPIKVSETVQGKESLYRINQLKGISYSVTKDHLLHLINIKDNKMINMSIAEYISIPSDKVKYLQGFKVVNKRIQKTAISIEHIDKDFCAGFKLNKTGLFLLEDNTVLHY